ncbi:hypothetical protein [Peterkaempfera sp. SMS 1(5)a]|uniref:hypothetical protein n=1 Tax=Peterkaempfera podocarpi TaxID=3232308 RepID=UPI00367005FD
MGFWATGVSMAAGYTALHDGAAGLDVGAVGVDAGAVHPGHGGEVTFGSEGCYPHGHDHLGREVIQSRVGGPVLKSTGEAVDPNDITW